MATSTPHRFLRHAAAHRRWVLGLLTTAVLSGCGGGDSTPLPPVLTAAADAFTLAAGQTGQLLANDRIGDALATVGAAGNVAFTLTTASLPAGVTVVDGVVTVSAAAVPGAVSITYRICQAGSTSNCADGSAQLTIPAPPIVATADSFTLGIGSSADLLANDTLGGTPATATRVTASAVGTLPTGITLTPAGVVTAGTGAVPGSYAVGYRICQTVAPSNCANSTANLTVPALGSLSGRAIDAASAAGIAGVRVSVGGQSTTTDSTGAFNLSGVSANSRASVVFSAPTHTETVRIASISAAATTNVQARMLRVGASADVAVATGGTVTMTGSPAQVVLPANGVQRTDGTVPTGNMRVSITPIDPSSDTSVMPGDFTTVVSSVPAPIESFGALGVTLADSAGAALNLATGRTATIRIPVATRNPTVPATIPLFFFDNASGRWVQEGTATLAGTGATRYYEGTVTHFSTWNADQVYNTVRYSGCLADANGARIAGAQVQADGVDYSGTSSATTDAGGNFSIAMRRDSQATLVGLNNGLLTNTVRAGPFSTDPAAVATCLTLGQTGAGVTMKLTWGQNPSDLDSYLYTPSGARINYTNQGSLLAAPFANLDVDDTSSFGPEVITITKLMIGTYKYAVNNYTGQSGGLFSASSARVELNVPGRAAELFTVPTTGETPSTNWWLLFEMDVDGACNITIRRTGTYSTSPPSTPATSTPTYCTRP